MKDYILCSEKGQCLKQVWVLVLTFNVTWSGFFLRLPSTTKKLDKKNIGAYYVTIYSEFMCILISVVY